MYALTTLPELSRTFAVFLCPEFGFLGLVMPTLRHTPFIAGRFAALSAGDTACRAFFAWRPLVRVRSWLRVTKRGEVEENERVEGEEKRCFERTEGRDFDVEIVRRVSARRACSAEGDGIGGISRETKGSAVRAKKQGGNGVRRLSKASSYTTQKQDMESDD
jgi:hypothetical protein